MRLHAYSKNLLVNIHMFVYFSRLLTQVIQQSTQLYITSICLHQTSKSQGTKVYVDSAHTRTRRTALRTNLLQMTRQRCISGEPKKTNRLVARHTWYGMPCHDTDKEQRCYYYYTNLSGTTTHESQKKRNKEERYCICGCNLYYKLHYAFLLLVVAK